MLCRHHVQSLACKILRRTDQWRTTDLLDVCERTVEVSKASTVWLLAIVLAPDGTLFLGRSPCIPTIDGTIKFSFTFSPKRRMYHLPLRQCKNGWLDCGFKSRVILLKRQIIQRRCVCGGCDHLERWLDNRRIFKPCRLNKWRNSWVNSLPISRLKS